MAENGRTNDGIVVNYNLTSEFCSVADDNVTAENAVVSNVHALHEQVVVAHNCCALGCGTTRDGDILANAVVVANLAQGFFSTVFEILRLCRDTGTWEYLVIVSQTGTSM